MVLPMNNK